MEIEIIIIRSENIFDLLEYCFIFMEKWRYSKKIKSTYMMTHYCRICHKCWKFRRYCSKLHIIHKNWISELNYLYFTTLWIPSKFIETYKRYYIKFIYNWQITLYNIKEALPWLVKIVSKVFHNLPAQLSPLKIVRLP